MNPQSFVGKKVTVKKTAFHFRVNKVRTGVIAVYHGRDYYHVKLDDGSGLNVKRYDMVVHKDKLVCKHPSTRIFSWFAYNCETGKNDILCAGCCDCGKVLAGGATL